MWRPAPLFCMIVQFTAKHQRAVLDADILTYMATLQHVTGLQLVTGREFTYVFERPPLFHQVSERLLHYTGCPLVHFALDIICSPDNTFNALRQNHTDTVTYTDITTERGVVPKHSSFMD